MPTPVTLNIRRTAGGTPAFAETVDLDTLTPKARALAEAIHASAGHQPIGILCATGKTKGDAPNFAWRHGTGPEADAIATQPVTTVIRPTPLRADSVTPPEEWLEREAHGLTHDVYPIAGSRDSLTTLDTRVPSADAAREDRCLSLDTVRSYLADTHGLVMSPTGWSLLWKIGHLPEPRHHAVGGRLPLWHVDDIDAYGTRDYDRWTISQVADHLGYQGTSAAGSARKQMSRWGLDAIGRAPGRGGESLYAADQVQAAHAARPGKGRHGARRSEDGKFADRQ
ncbi:hypothetical protein SAM40697_6919 [Streptomyces ambofaciens]|uniref:Uncharacterized protein n=1 Tax=Streptomyces ambofaciens TaxID=1889 RepID=Q0JWR8_STRAM|nr:hypothetical protein [Streptomyces ambofaciens]ANB03970.1 hypothetical protein SAM40697_0006 [Streptomyces ambofaciens]ANB10870.1 hypothetical protein SAM40697_6919 [Streptomyces ambofaciens]CAK50850.1 hypothetical protein DSMT0006 [Streptomyces ambofaciens]CAK51088.1 hypothetical protein DSMT0006 [Streptomyces ambofaciens]